MFEQINPLPHLPSCTGPHTVGSLVYETALSSLEERLATSGHQLGLTTIKFRLFYPVEASATSPSTSIPWVPEPQSLHFDAYVKLAKLGPWLHTLISTILPYYLSNATIPAVADGPFLLDHIPRRVLIFSHGLIGNMNSHSALLGELASHGLVCVAIEHRDGSGPLSIINSTSPIDQLPPTEATSIPFERITLLAHPEAYEKRDRQLQIRLFELSATFSALLALNSTTRPSDVPSHIPPNSLNLSAGNIAWAGHSFGGASMINFVKSVYRRQHPLSCYVSTTLQAQITSYSPVILLDPWFFPLRSPTLKHLLDLPLPCHSPDRRPTNNTPTAPTTLSIHSTEYAYCWPQFQSHPTKILSPQPKDVQMDTDEEAMAEMMRYKSRADYIVQARRRYYESLDDGEGLDFDLDLSGIGEEEEEEEEEQEAAAKAHDHDSSKHHTERKEYKSEIETEAKAKSQCTVTDQHQQPPLPPRRSTSPQHPNPSLSPSPSPSPSLPPTPSKSPPPPPPPNSPSSTSPTHTIHLPHTSHITLTDTGLLFPYLSYWYFAQWDAHAALANSVAAILGVLGIPEQSVKAGEGRE